MRKSKDIPAVRQREMPCRDYSVNRHSGQVCWNVESGRFYGAGPSIMVLGFLTMPSSIGNGFRLVCAPLCAQGVSYSLYA